MRQLFSLTAVLRSVGVLVLGGVIFSQAVRSESMASPSPVLTDGCPAACIHKNQRLATLKKEKQRVVDLLGANRFYLAQISAKQASKFLKVDSNIEIILQQLDAIKLQISQAEQDYSRSNCATCDRLRKRNP